MYARLADPELKPLTNEKCALRLYCYDLDKHIQRITNRVGKNQYKQNAPMIEQAHP